jgi:hypothetical protein
MSGRENSTLGLVQKLRSVADAAKKLRYSRIQAENDEITNEALDIVEGSDSGL